MRSVVAAALSLGCFACVGTLEGPRAEGPVPGAPSTVEAPTTAIPRASRRELERTVNSVFGLQGAALRNLPADAPSSVSPVTLAEEEVFDTLASTKEPTQVFVEGLESLAFEVARDWSANRAAVDSLAGCAPANGTTTDSACLGRLVEALAVRLWRRPATAAERDEVLAAAQPFAADGHYVSVRMVTASMLLAPEFVYRSELGATVAPGLVRLDNFELLTRLSAFLWGDAPTPDMLAALGPVELDDAALTSLVDAMLSDPRAQTQMRSFHQLWLRYPNLLIADAALATDMRAETDALVSRALTPGTSWQTLFTATQTFVTPALAAHYALPSPGATAGWVDVAPPRAGVLTHGSFLSLSSTRITDTLPSRRGAMIARRALCQVVLPPPKDVNIDNGVPVPAGACKAESYAAHRARGSACAGCHATIDGVGFGFEPLDGQGRVRSSDEGNAACTLDGKGTAMGQPFTGAREFVTAQVDTITRCAVSNVLRFAYRDRFVPEDRVAQFHGAFRASNHDFAALMRAVALDPRFRLRVSDEGQP